MRLLNTEVNFKRRTINERRMERLNTEITEKRQQEHREEDRRVEIIDMQVTIKQSQGFALSSFSP